MAPPVRVLIADDEQLLGNALELILGADDRISVVVRLGACRYVTKEVIADGLVPEILRSVQP